MTESLQSWVGPITRRHGRLAIKLITDFSLVVFAVCLAYVVRFEEMPEGTYGRQMMLIASALPAFRILVWARFGIYTQSWRLFGLREASVMAASTVAVTTGLVMARLAMPYLLPAYVAVPFSVVALEGLFTLTGSTMIRVMARLIDERAIRRTRVRATPAKRALLVGAGRTGRQAVREFRHRPDSDYEVVGFLDDDVTRQHQVIEGVRVLGTTREAATVVSEHDVQVLILTMPSVSRGEIRQVVDRCKAANVPVRTVPGFYELLADKISITTIRPLEIEDLLGREVVGLDRSAWERVYQCFHGQVIAVTGAGGSIGSELCRQMVALEPAKLLLIENNENNLFDIDNETKAKLGDRVIPCLVDVRERSDIDRLFAKYRPDVVFHAAAYKHVPMMERHPSGAVHNNVLGTQMMVEAAHRYGVGRFLMVSTDKAVNPANVMGASKRAAEMVVQAQATTSDTKFCCVRFGNVLGSRGSVLHTFRRQIETGGPVTVTHPEVTRFFMTIPEAVRLVIQAAAVGQGGEVFLLDMGEPVKIVDMAKQMIELAGLTTEDVPIDFIGLRPGEKLYEELLRDEEGARPSEIDGVFLAQLAAVEPAILKPWVERLARAAERRDSELIRRLLGELTGYQPNPDAPVAPDALSLDDMDRPGRGRRSASIERSAFSELVVEPSSLRAHA